MHTSCPVSYRAVITAVVLITAVLTVACGRQQNGGGGQDRREGSLPSTGPPGDRAGSSREMVLAS